MQEQLEIEYKILLTKETYDKICYDFNHLITNEYSQTNYYFSHPKLIQNKMMLRIREKNNTYELTLKRPYLNHNIETNISLTKQQKDDFIHHLDCSNEIITLLNELEIDYHELQQDLKLTTYRKDISLPLGILSLDENTFSTNEKDYELEFEVNNQEEGFKHFLELIQPYHLKYTHNCESKFKRVLKKANR